MSRTATGAVLISCLALFLVGPELAFGPITSTSRADERPAPTPAASVVVIRPAFASQPVGAAPAPAAPVARASRGARRTPTGAAAPGGDTWPRLRAGETPTNGGPRPRPHYQLRPPTRES